ncbi:MAG TPA: methylenetetrahydrofolate reductase [Nitrososphaerales archaeon]|nr:methylenetetrahydrofolate reductase [Nitrososphaerales archaeon]HUK74880.1 methylenetetrahydrofolate reductase [Nitrososphaerales archaeon]
MRLAERLRRGIFTTVVEVFPPNFSSEATKEPLLGLKQKTQDVVSRVKKVENLADCLVVADMKDLGRLKLSSVYTAATLKQELDLEVIPVIAVRDSNRSAVRTLFLSALSYGLDSVMLVWGDKYLDGEGSANVYDYPSLSHAIKEMRTLADRANVDATILAPVNVATLDTKKGAEIAASRIASGADCLLAQPPTSDASVAFPEHLRLVTASGLRSNILLNVFPFRDREDIEACRKRFGWRIPQEADRLADEGGEARLIKESKNVVEKMREDRLPGVYVSTRGRPELARFILD